MIEANNNTTVEWTLGNTPNFFTFKAPALSVSSFHTQCPNSRICSSSSFHSILCALPSPPEKLKAKPTEYRFSRSTWGSAKQQHGGYYDALCEALLGGGKVVVHYFFARQFTRCWDLDFSASSPSIEFN